MVKIEAFFTDSADLASGELSGVTDALWSQDGSHAVIVFEDGHIVRIDQEGQVVCVVQAPEVLR